MYPNSTEVEVDYIEVHEIKKVSDIRCSISMSLLYFETRPFLGISIFCMEFSDGLDQEMCVYSNKCGIIYGAS